jgi:hypothetical protein
MMGGPPYHEAMMRGRGRAMTEEQWLESSDPQAMLRLVTENPDHQNIDCATPRKLRLFAVACCSLCKCGNQASNKERATWDAKQWAVVHDVVGCLCTRVARVGLLRHIFGNVFRPGLWRTCPCLYAKVPGPDCQRCKGVGSLPVELPGKTCGACGGNGKNRGVAFSMENCYLCSGTGRLTRWPDPIPALAQAVYDGEPHYALHDALVDVCLEAAAELAKETRVWRGYWLVDMLLGKR